MRERLLTVAGVTELHQRPCWVVTHLGGREIKGKKEKERKRNMGEREKRESEREKEREA